MARRWWTLGAALAASAAIATPAAAAPTTNINNPTYWEYGGIYSCTKKEHRDGLRSYTRPSPVAFVVIKTGQEYFVSDLGESNEGDSTYYFDRDISFVITCNFTPGS